MSQPLTPAPSGSALSDELRALASGWRPRGGVSVSGEAPWLHTEVARRMAERLPFIRQQPRRVLDWASERSGSADLLGQHYRQAQLLRADITGHVHAGPAAPWWRRWRSGADTTASAPTAPVDLLWANMVLHWTDDPDTLLSAWHTALQVDGFVMFSCFGPDTLRELHALYTQLGWGPPGRPFPDMHDLGDGLVKVGFGDPVMDMEKLRLTWDSPQALLDELMSLGRNTHPQRHAGLRPRAWRAELLTQLDTLRGSDGRLGLTFEVVYGHAFRPAPRAKVTPETTISLSDMRQMTRPGARRTT